MKKQPNLFDKANTYIQETETSLVNLMTAVAPWGAPLIPATMTYHGMTTKLGTPHWVALVGAGIVEILGLATVSTAMRFWQNNRSPRMANYKRMPVKVPVACFAWYLLVVLVVNVLMEAPWQPEAQIYVNLVARALLTTLTIPAAVILAIRAIHQEALKGVYVVAQPAEQPKEQPDMQPDVQPELQGNRAEVYQILVRNPHATDNQIGMQLGITRQAASKHRNALLKDGYFGKNGH